MNKVDFLSLKHVTAMHLDEIQDAVKRVVSSGWYLQGEENRLFEEEYSNFIGTDFTIGCANGYDALYLMLRAYKELGRLHDGDEIIVPANTYIATILAVTQNNLTPVLIEPSTDTLQIDERLIEQYITKRTRAILIVHLYGRLAYTQRIFEICDKYGLLLFEDNAQAHGCRYFDGDKVKLTGSLGHAAAHSFYPGKNLGALGDGGAVTTNDAEVAQVVRTLANYGSSEKYVFKYVGRNSRLDELQAAVLRVKLRYLNDENKLRVSVAEEYYNRLDNNKVTLPERAAVGSNVYHLFPVLCSARDALRTHLLRNGVQTLIHYPIPPHKQECYSEMNHKSFPLTERIAEQELSLPISPCLTKEDVEFVINAVNGF